MQEAFRLLRVGKDGRPRTLFHLHKGSRDLPLDVQLKADEFQAWNPGKCKGPGFISGWHVLPDKQQVCAYLERFTKTDDIVISRVLVNEVRRKPRSKVSLARYMQIKSNDWAQAIQSGFYQQ